MGTHGTGCEPFPQPARWVWALGLGAAMRTLASHLGVYSSIPQDRNAWGQGGPLPALFYNTLTFALVGEAPVEEAGREDHVLCPRYPVS